MGHFARTTDFKEPLSVSSRSFSLVTPFTNFEFGYYLSRVIVYYAVQGGSKFYKSVHETLVCDHLNESYLVVLSCGFIYYAVQGGSNFKINFSLHIAFCSVIKSRQM